MKNAATGIQPSVESQCLGMVVETVFGRIVVIFDLHVML